MEKSEVERSVLAFIEDELGQAIQEKVLPESDLSKSVNWNDLHPDERIPFFLCNFCHEFKIRNDAWPEYRKKGHGLMRFFFRGGPDDQYFMNLDIPSIPVRSLIKMAHTKRWFHPF